MNGRTLQILAIPLTLMAAGCGSAGGLGEVLGGVLNAPGTETGTATVTAEIQANDQQQQMVQIVTDNGEQGVVRWDAGTEVIYKNETYGAGALERGDLVQMRLQQTSDGALYTDYVLVTQSVQERSGNVNGADGDLIQLQGNVTGINSQTGQFQMRTTSGATVVVSLPYNPSATTADRFRRLGEGDYVRVEGRRVTQTRVELTRFY